MTRGYRACSVACELALALAAVTSCRQIVGFDGQRQASHHEAGNHDAGSLLRAAGPDAGTLFDPKPFLSGPECTPCIEENCQKPIADCATDDFCSRWLADARALDQPVIISPDFYHLDSDAAWASRHGAPDVTVAQNDLERCVATQCTAACQLGRDFSCVGKFDWPAAHETHPNRIELRVRLLDVVSPGSSFDGWRVRACSHSQCERPLGEAMTQDGGFATLSIDLASTALFLPEFYGFLLIDAGPNFLPTQIDVSGPYCDRDYMSLFMFSRDLVNSVGEARGIPYDVSQGLLQIFPLDCSNRSASGVTVEVWRYDAAGVHPCGDDCKVWYPDSSGSPDGSLPDFSSSSQGFATARAMTGDIMLVMRDTTTRLPLSVLRPVTVRAGYVHQIFIEPASMAELVDFSKVSPTAP